MTTHDGDEDDVDRVLRQRLRDLEPPNGTTGAIAATVMQRLPPRPHRRATIALLAGAVVAGLAAAWLAPDLVAAVAGVLGGDPRARVDGLTLISVPVIVWLVVRARSTPKMTKRPGGRWSSRGRPPATVSR